MSRRFSIELERTQEGSLWEAREGEEEKQSAEEEKNGRREERKKETN
jgi:hypothetical protein